MNDSLTLRNVREVNRINVLRSVLAGRGCIRRDEIAAANNISIMTVKKVIEELQQMGIVEEEDMPSSVGRRPKILRISDRTGVVVCVSFASKEYFTYRITDFYNNLLDERQIVLLEQFSYKENLELMKKTLRQDLKRLDRKCTEICLSVPSAYYEDTDLVNYDLIPELQDLHLRKEFQDSFETENVSVVHDVFAAAQAEYNRLCKNGEGLFYCYIGYGVGGAYINEGKWQSGNDLVAGEIGQMIVRNGAATEKLEDMVSIPGILNKIRNNGGKKMSFYDAMHLYKDGDPIVTKTIHETVEEIITLVYNITWLINPAYIVIGGLFDDFVNLVVQACGSFVNFGGKSPINNSCRVFAAACHSGEMEGCFDIAVSHWVDKVSKSVPEIN